MNLDQFKEQVTNNKILIDPLWNKECLAINIQHVFEEDAQLFFQALQSEILKKTGEPLLLCPANTLHISIAFILGVKETYQYSKEQIWESIKAECLGELELIINHQPTIELVFDKLIATDSAIIALVSKSNEVQSLRRKFNQVKPINKWGRNNSKIVHTTLFRYKEKLNNPLVFHSILNESRINLPVKIQQIDVIKELRYPSIETELIKSLRFKEN